MHMITVGMKKGSASMHLNRSRREGRVNIIAALCDQSLIAPFTVEGGQLNSDKTGHPL